jgi:hypothetical protein
MEPSTATFLRMSSSVSISISAIVTGARRSRRTGENEAGLFVGGACSGALGTDSSTRGSKKRSKKNCGVIPHCVPFSYIY